MKITTNRATPEPPPVKSFTLELSPEQLRYIGYMAANSTGEAARNLYSRLCGMSELDFVVVNHRLTW